MRTPVFAIVGRPNVGKSTLFNRLAGRPIAIVENVPGVTRDRIYAKTDVDTGEGLGRVIIIDTGGLGFGKADDEEVLTKEMLPGVREQTQLAIDEADVIFQVVDARAGVTSDDLEVARLLRKSGRPVVVAANKMDSPAQVGLEGELHRLGIGDVVPISSAHGRGIGELLDTAMSKLDDELRAAARVAALAEEEPELDAAAVDEALDAAEADAEGEELAPPPAESRLPEVLKVAIVGRPNAGKSSLVNRLLGEERHLVSPVAGTTMDAVDSFLDHGGHRFRLIDTAGIRRKRSIGRQVERFAVVSALKAMDRADLVILLIDAESGIADQDLKIASLADDKGKAVVVVVNKWDTARAHDLEAEKVAEHIRHEMSFLAHAPIRFVSAKTGKRVFDVLDTVVALAEKHFLRVGTGEVNRALRAAAEAHQPPVYRGRRTKILYGAQVKVAPVTFVIAANDPDGFHFSYRRYLTNALREHFGFGGAPIRIFFRARKQQRARRGRR
ncbi:MAG: ribosome biogenesis GTPase Der [Deltaproteobacteria bacterium]|nr:ribosome biogenesis GTPase Der [Deltaproteobacteria bacterium]